MDNVGDRLEKELKELKRRSMDLIAEAAAIAEKISELDGLAKQLKQEEQEAREIKLTVNGSGPRHY